MVVQISGAQHDGRRRRGERISRAGATGRDQKGGGVSTAGGRDGDAPRKEVKRFCCAEQAAMARRQGGADNEGGSVSHVGPCARHSSSAHAAQSQVVSTRA